jgi:hypothetical protein
MLDYLQDIIDAHPTCVLLRLSDAAYLDAGMDLLGTVRLEAWEYEYCVALDANGLLLVRFRA